jgi:type IV secretion system protein VirD4
MTVLACAPISIPSTTTMQERPMPKSKHTLNFKAVRSNGIPLGFRQSARATRTIGFSQSSLPNTVELAELITDASEHHVMVVAPTGAGKGRNIIIPTLLHDPSPAIVLDIKGEAAAVTARYRAEQMGHHVTIIDPWCKLGPNLGQLNPLALIDPAAPSLGDDAFAIASLFEPPNDLVREPYWNERATALIAGIIAHVVTVPTETDRTLRRVYELLQADDLVYSLANLLDTHGKDMNRFAYFQIAAFLSLSADTTRMCIVSCVHSLIRAVASPAVQFALDNGLDPQAIVSGAPHTVYLVVPPEKLVSHGSILRLYLSSMIDMMISRSQRPLQSTLFIIDEAAQLGPMPQLRQAITLTRGYGVRAMIFLQSLAQLKTMFPTDHEVLVENCGTLISFCHQRQSMSEGVSKMMGDITADALFAMKPHELAVKVGREETQIFRRIDYLVHEPFSLRAVHNPMFRMAD